MGWLEPVTLRGEHAILEPLGQGHGEDLKRATADGRLWELWYTAVPTVEGMAAEIERRLELQTQASMLPFAVIEAASGEAVGMTTFMNADRVHRRLEIGSTWYRSRVQRSAVNSQCKLLLLCHAFETLDCIAVEFRTHFHNHASRRGIERLGAKLDGVLRSHMVVANGTLRDTCVYSIVASEWPTTKAHLTYQLAKPRE